jgi:hypothetical protein
MQEHCRKDPVLAQNKVRSDGKFLQMKPERRYLTRRLAELQKK